MARTRRIRWGVWLAVAPVLLLMALVGVGVVATAIGGNCAFDLPPGDVTTMTLANDTQATVEFVECNNETCSDYDRSGDPGGFDIVKPGSADAAWNHEDCGREPVGIVDQHGKAIGCIILPVSDPPKVTTWRVSQKEKCMGPTG